MAGVEKIGAKPAQNGQNISFADQPTVEAQADETKALHSKALSWFWSYVQRFSATFLALYLGQADQAGIERVIEAKGSEANISLRLRAKGTGRIGLAGTSYAVPAGQERVISLNGNEEMLSDLEVDSLFVGTSPEQQALRDWLTVDANWLPVGTMIVTPATTFKGYMGQQHVSTTAGYHYECVEDGVWIRYPTGKTYVDIAISGNTIKANLENIANWTNKVYVGPAINGTYQGQEHYDPDYYFKFIQDNIPIRTARV